MLMIGNLTPDLEVEALMPDGRFERLHLGALAGRWAVLFFYPKDFTFVCPTEIRAYEAFAPRFREADAALLGASVDSVQVHRAWVEDDPSRYRREGSSLRPLFLKWLRMLLI